MVVYCCYLLMSTSRTYPVCHDQMSFQKATGGARKLIGCV